MHITQNVHLPSFLLISNSTKKVHLTKGCKTKYLISKFLIAPRINFNLVVVANLLEGL